MLVRSWFSQTCWRKLLIELCNNVKLDTDHELKRLGESGSVGKLLIESYKFVFKKGDS